MKIELNPRQSRNFWSKVNGNGPSVKGMKTKCWQWTGGIGKNGYGIFGFNKKSVSAHRLSWMLRNGEIPNNKSYHGVCVCHKCDNKLCVNPNHLFLGTQTDNVKDQVKKGRQRPAKGEDNNLSKLTAEQVLRIRELGKKGYSQTEISNHFPVGQPVISRIINRDVWKHLPEVN